MNERCCVLQVHAAIRADPSPQKKERKKPSEAKTWKAKKLTYDERKQKLKVTAHHHTQSLTVSTCCHGYLCCVLQVCVAAEVQLGFFVNVFVSVAVEKGKKSLPCQTLSGEPICL